MTIPLPFNTIPAFVTNSRDLKLFSCSFSLRKHYASFQADFSGLLNRFDYNFHSGS